MRSLYIKNERRKMQSEVYYIESTDDIVLVTWDEYFGRHLEYGHGKYWMSFAWDLSHIGWVLLGEL